MLRYYGSYYDTEQGSIFRNGLGLRWELIRFLELQSRLDYLRGSEYNEAVALAAFVYDARSRSQKGLRAQLSSEYSKTERDNEKSDNLVNQLMLDYGHDYMRSSGFVRSTSTADNTSTYLGVNAASSFITNADGAITISKPPTEDAVLLVDLRGMKTRSQFDVIFNGQVFETVTAGRIVAVGVNSYQSYDITIRPVEGGELVDYEPTVQRITFFPGNVVRKSWDAAKVFILLGRLLDEQGKPIAHQHIRGTREYTVTEDDGSFQAEITGSDKLFVKSKYYDCELKLEFTEMPQYFIEVGDVRCLKVQAAHT
jgi:outer membrane usher protein FimD/PapC